MGLFEFGFKKEFRAVLDARLGVSESSKDII